ncbi:unnamed protein product [Meloidogyne enterolobii]|uniref:Uncharacterized protein n=1 Tax=Meloidogyne enterolobii TaxID=390850 RepID=A0ACB0ZMD1_MELEN
MEDNYNAASQALSVSYDSSVCLRSQALKLQIYGNGLYDRNGLLFSKIDEVFTQDFRDRVNQELDSFKNVATEHKNEFGKAIHSTLSTMIKQVNDGASYSSDMSQLFDNTTQKMENFVEKEFVQIQSPGKTPKRKLLGSELNENLVYIPPPKKLFEEQKGLITPKRMSTINGVIHFWILHLSRHLFRLIHLKCNLQETTLTSTTKTGRLEPVDEEKKNECGTSLSFK